MYGYEVVNRLLVADGVETVFQYMAEDTMELVADATRNHGELTVIHARHEQGAMAMADGYSRSGDRIGVCVVGRGPGIAQTGTALLNARKNGSRLLAIAPTPARTDRHDPKEFDQSGYLRSTAGEVLTARSDETLVPTVREALRRVHVGESPLAVQIPKDVLKGPIPEVEVDDIPFANDAGEESRPGRPPAGPGGGRLEPEPARVERAVELFLETDAFQPPVILAGDGAVRADAREALEALAERLSAVLLTTLKGRDLFEDHPFAVGFAGTWGEPLSNEFLAEASYVLAVGCSLNDHTLDEGRLIDDDATVVHVDADPASIGRYAAVDCPVVGDARLTAEALSAAFEREGVDREGELWTDDLRERIASTSPLDGRDYPAKDGRMDPRAVVRKLEAVLPSARLVGTDGGQFRKWALHELSAPPADSIISCDFAAIGLGLPMGIGIGRFLEDERAGGDDRTAVTLCGDGGFMMSLQELETAVRHEIPVVVVVGNDSSLGSEYHYLAVQGGPADVARLETPVIADVATALGAEGHRASDLDGIDAVADRLRDPDGPVVLECLIDHEVRHHSY